MPHIHWTAPSVMAASLVAGMLFALGHHLFYASLDRKHAPTSLEAYEVLGTHVSIQQFNTAVGTAFAFLVRASLMLSVSVAYFQIFIWSVAKHGSEGTSLAHLDVMTSALQDLVSLASVTSWWRRPWLWILAVVAWLIPLASIVTPATLSVGVDFPPSISANVPRVEFSSLNLVAPMAEYGTTGWQNPGFNYMYAGPSLTVQKITDAVAAQSAILPVAAPSANSTWNLAFNGPSLGCSPVAAGFRQAVLDNVLNYTFARSQGTMEANCAFGPGYVAWHPGMMAPDDAITEYLPFMLGSLNSSRDPLNNDNSHGYPYDDMGSFFVAIAPTLFSSTSAEGYLPPTMCRGKPWYKAGLARYHNTSTVLRCDLHNTTYDTTFSFVNGVQEVTINNITDITSTPMVTLGETIAYFDSDTNQTDMTLQPHACNASDTSCLYNPFVLSTLSYQAIMHAFTDLVTGVISLGDAQDLQTLITSTTQISSTILADTPELAFLQSTQTQNQQTPASAQQRAATWQQQPFSGLVNAAAETKSTLPFQQALEQLFQNITISLMSAPDLQPNASSIYYPAATEVQLTTRENIYTYAMYKLWLAYGLAIGATLVIALLGIAAMIANGASFSNRFSTILRLSRGAQLDCEIDRADLSGHEPMPEYVKRANVRFTPEQMSGSKAGSAYALVDREGKDDESEVTTQQLQNERP